MTRPILPIVLALALSLIAMGSATAYERTFTLEAKMVGYFGVDGEIKGRKNPTLTADVGDKVTIVIINGEPMAHDICLDGHRVKSTQVLKLAERTQISFVADKDDAYYCTVPGHRQIGMEGRFEVKRAEGAEDKHGPIERLHAPMAHAAIEPAKPVTIPEIGAVASDVYPQSTHFRPTTVTYQIKSSEEIATLADGSTFEYWTFNRQVPGPLLRARVGDTVKIMFSNDAASKMVHSIDFHAATGPGGGAKFLQVAPGQEKTLTFKALNPGVYVYHCATPHIPTHLARGMYGLIVIDPEQALPKVDREFYVMQGDFYTGHRPNVAGHHMQDDQRLLDENPSFVVMNGRVGSLTGDRALRARVGETVRIWFGVGGPNLTSSFHVIGEIFDRVYRDGDLVNPPARSVQTTLVAPGGATAVDIILDMPGTYLLVDHALSRLDKGCVGILKVEGDDNPEIMSLAK